MKIIPSFLKESAQGLGEAIVIGTGYGQFPKKKDVTGAIGLVALPNADKTPITGTSQLLEGTRGPASR